MVIYDRIAPFYNRALSRPFFNYLRPVVQALLREYDINPPASILEVACGPGHLCAYLRERRYTVTGLDISLMQGTASPHRYGFPFAVARMQALPVTGTFDVVFNLYDSINHLMTLPDLELTFREVNQVLRPEGYFIFDTNNRTAFKRIWADRTPYVHTEDDFTLTMTTSYSTKDRTSTALVHVQTPDGEIVSTFHERYFTRREIRATLKRAGLHLLRHTPWCPSKESYLGTAVKDLWIAIRHETGK